MGKLFKLGMVVLSACVLIFIIVGVIRGIPNVGNNTNQSSSAKIGKAAFDQIRVGDRKTGEGGMTLAEVEKILGPHTDLQEGHSGNLKMDVYIFAGNAGPNSILITFIKGHVSGKSQTGLK